jgi:hypothetical protein
MRSLYFSVYSSARRCRTTAIASPAPDSLLSEYIYVAIASLQRRVSLSCLVASLFGLLFFFSLSLCLSISFSLLLLFPVPVLNSGLAVSSVEEERSGGR